MPSSACAPRSNRDKPSHKAPSGGRQCEHLDQLRHPCARFITPKSVERHPAAMVQQAPHRYLFGLR